MNDIISFLFSDAGYSPHGYCLAWNPALIFTHVFSDVLISFSYFSIPVALYYFVRRGPSFRYKNIVLLFAVFIFACGLTHMFGVLTLWQPMYGLQAIVKLLSSAASIASVTGPMLPAAVESKVEQYLK